MKTHVQKINLFFKIRQIDEVCHFNFFRTKNSIITDWLKAGYIKKNMTYPTFSNSISLCNSSFLPVKRKG